MGNFCLFFFSFFWGGGGWGGDYVNKEMVKNVNMSMTLYGMLTENKLTSKPVKSRCFKLAMYSICKVCILRIFYKIRCGLYKLCFSS